MPIDYDEAINEKQRETPEDEEHWQGFVNYAEEYDEEFDGEHLEDAAARVRTILGIIPDSIKPETGGRDVGIPKRPTTGLPSFDVDLGNLDQRGLLEVIARILIAQTAGTFDIADAVEPYRGVSVSGTNATLEADEAQVVVPGSAGSNVPTRMLMLKASEDNQKPIFIGDDDIDPENGWRLGKGQSLSLGINLATTALYMASEESGQEIELLGLI